MATRVQILLKGDQSNLAKALRESEKNVKKFEKKIANLENELKKLNTTSKKSSKDVSKLAAAFKKITALLKIGTFAGVTAAIYKLGKSVIQTAAAFELQRTNFEVLLQSTEKGKQLFEDVAQLSAYTPFQLQDVSKGTERLLAFGVASDEVVDTMSRLGDLALGNTHKLERMTLAYGKLRAKGRATLEELNQFTEAGVPLQAELGKQLNLTEDALFTAINRGEISYANVEKAIKSLTNEQGQFYKGSERASKTLTGTITTLKDNWSLLSDEVAKSWGLVNAAKSAVSGFTAVVQYMRQIFAEPLTKEDFLPINYQDIQKVNEELEKIEETTSKIVELANIEITSDFTLFLPDFNLETLKEGLNVSNEVVKNIEKGLKVYVTSGLEKEEKKRLGLIKDIEVVQKAITELTKLQSTEGENYTNLLKTQKRLSEQLAESFAPLSSFYTKSLKPATKLGKIQLAIKQNAENKKNIQNEINKEYNKETKNQEYINALVARRTELRKEEIFLLAQLQKETQIPFAPEVSATGITSPSAVTTGPNYAEVVSKIENATKSSYQRQIDDTILTYDTLIKEAEQYGLKTVEIERKKSETLSKIRANEAGKYIQTIGTIANQLTSLANLSVSVANQGKEAEIAKLDEELEKYQENKDEKIQGYIDEGYSKEEADKKYEDGADAIRKKKQQKEKEARKLAFEANKATSIVNAAISGALLGVQLAAPPPTGLGPIAGPILASILTATQIGLIAAQKFPGLYEGGLVKGAGNEGNLFRLGDKNKDELVIPLDRFLEKFENQKEQMYQDNRSFNFTISGVIGDQSEIAEVMTNAIYEVEQDGRGVGVVYE